MISYHAQQCHPAALKDTLVRTSSSTPVFFQPIVLACEKTDDWIFQSRYLSSYNIFCVLRVKLERLIDTASNWNSYGSPPPTEVAVANAGAILQELQARSLEPENVHPSADGGVAFSFVSDTISRAAIECLNTGESYVLLYDLNGSSETLEWPPAAKRDQLAIIECVSAHLRSEGLGTSNS